MSTSTTFREPSSPSAVSADPPRPLRRVLAFVASLITPGAGHVLRGHTRRGFAWAFGMAALELVLVFLMPVGWATIVIMAMIGALALLACALDTLWLAGTTPSWAIVLASWTALLIFGGITGEQTASYYTEHYLQAFTIPSASMEPTLARGDYVVTDKSAYRTRGPGRGDIVVFTSPLDERRHLVKRIVGVPGDRIEIRGRQVFVNGTALEEPYVAPAPEAPSSGRCVYAFGCDPTFVPVDSYFVMGDNRDRSHDSRHWGLVRRARIVGRVLAIYWSWDAGRRLPRLTRVGTAL